MKLAALLVWFLFAAGLLGAQTEEFDNDTFQGELWASLSPLTENELERQPTDQKIILALLEETRRIFSGMIYGWKFTYRPSDTARQAAEVLDVVPLGEIPWGDPRLETVKTRVVDQENRLYVLFRYRLKNFELERRNAWSGSNLVQAAGQGTMRITERLESRQGALNQAVKEALRNLLRPQYYNKPQEIRGELLLRQIPFFTIASGEYVCSARFQLRLQSVKEYLIY